LVSPEITMGLFDPMLARPPGEVVTMNDITGEPPSKLDGVKLTVAEPLETVTEVTVGAPGTSVGVIDELGAEEELVPAVLVAVTMN
jgi:hypothetical protein